MTTLTKELLADGLSARTGLSKQEAMNLLEVFFEQLRLAVEHGDDVRLSGFGNFILRNKVARPGRNPKTGQAFTITARRVVTFKAGQKLRARLDYCKGLE